MTVHDDRLEINEKINFGSNNAIITDDSHPILDLVADALLRNPQILMVEVAGHTNG